MTNDIDTQAESEQVAATPQELFSEAYNLSGLTSSVNNRTGSFQASVVLAQLTRGIQCPASFSLILFIGAPNHSGMIFTGTAAVSYFGFNVPRLDLTPLNSRIYCASGAVEEVVVPKNNDENRLGMLYHRTKDMLIERIPQPPYPTPIWDDKYQVSYKNGTVEYYDIYGYLIKMVSPAGHVLSFSYHTNNALSTVSDGHGNSIAMTYATQGNITTLTVTKLLAGEVDVRKVMIRKDTTNSTPEYYVDSVSMPNSEESILFTYGLKYGSQVLLEVIQPTGLKQIAVYKQIKYSDTQNVNVVDTLQISNKLDAVTPETPDVNIRYEYSENNFTGYTKGRTPVSGVDNCIMLTTGYTYTVTEKHTDLTIERTFNRFHLLIKEVTRDLNGFDSQTNEYTYPVQAGNITAQPDNYSFWTKLKTTYRRCELKREEFQECTYDDFGNLLSQTQASGIKTVNEYYAENSSESAGCPPDQKGYFRSYLKRTEVSPNPSAAVKPENKVSTFEYSKTEGYSFVDPNTSRTVVPYMILPFSSVLNGVGAGSTYYLDKARVAEAGLSGLFVGAKESTSNLSAGCVCMDIYNWSLEGDKVKVQTSYTAWKESEGQDSRVSQARGSVTYSLASGKVHIEVSPSNDTTKYEYNAQGFLTKKTSFLNTPYVEVEQYAFRYWHKVSDAIGWQNCCTLTTANNQVFNYYYNRNGQLTYMEFVGAPNQILQKLTYNEQGLLEADTSYEQGVTGVFYTGITVENTTRYTYQMRKLLLTDFADGTKEYSPENTVLRIHRSYSQPNGAEYFTYYNQYGLPAQSRVTFYESGSDVKSVATLEKKAYDGFGRLIQETSSSGGVTIFEYDRLDRLIKEQVIDAGSSPNQTNVTTYSYSEYIPVIDVPIRIESVIAQNRIMLASRSYDLLGRLEEQRTPGGAAEVVEKYSYASSISQQPSIIRINPGATPAVNDGEMQYQYDTVTQLVTQLVNTGTSSMPVATSTFNYNNLTKLITRATIVSDGTQCECDYVYNAFGFQLSMVTTAAQAGQSYGLAMRYSSCSKFVNRVEVTQGTEQSRLKFSVYNRYDSIGRLSLRNYVRMISQEIDDIPSMEFQISMTYLPSTSEFGAGQVEIIGVRVISNQLDSRLDVKMEISFGYNQFGTEAYREYKIDDAVVLRVENSFMPNLMLDKKVSKKTDTAIIHQDFRYNQAYGQLALSNSGASPEAAASTSYTFNGLYRLNTVVEPSATTQYTYLNDRVVSYRANQGAIQAFSYDSRGNVMTDNSQCSFKYNSANQLIWFSRAGEATQRYTYMYTPSGQLSQVKSPTGEINTYMYDGDNLIGEMSADSKALYFEVNGIKLGRFILDGALERFELYGSEMSGSVRFVCKYDDLGVQIEKMYYNYSDYGVRSEWS